MLGLLELELLAPEPLALLEPELLVLGLLEPAPLALELPVPELLGPGPQVLEPGHLPLVRLRQI